MQDTLELSREDSGTEKAPLIVESTKSGEARLLGGLAIPHFDKVSDPQTVERLSPEARNHVVAADLNALGVQNYGSFKSRGFGRPETPSHMELFFDGQPMTPARWPNEGAFEKIAGFPEDSAKNDDHGGKIGKLENGFYYDGDRPRRWQDTSTIWVHGYWAWDWANSYEKVASIDLEKRWIKTTPPSGHYGFRKGQRIYFVNILEELDQPGEWFADTAKGMLYFWPPSDPKGKETLISMIEKPVVTIKNASHIALRGLRFEAVRGRALSIEGGATNRVEGCVFRNIGNYAVSISGGAGHGVRSCDFENTGDGGVSVSGGDRKTLAPGGHFVENCQFDKIGRWSKCYVPAIIMSGVGLRASNNLIHNHPHCAILYGGNDHVIEGNEIHHVALETGDVGAIYSGRDYSYRGNVIRYNYIHDTGGVGMGSMGVYMDDCVSGTLIYGNIFYKVQRAAFLGGGRDFTVENNIFIDCTPAVELDGRGLDKSPVWHSMVSDYMKKQLAQMPSELYRERYPAIRDLDKLYETDAGIPPGNVKVLRNISVGGKWLQIGWHAKPEHAQVSDNFVDQDPGFLSRQAGDFRLNDGSPAYKTGFKPLPWDKIGLQNDEYRKTAKRPWPVRP